MYYFGTLFDKNYLTRGLTLYNSMQNHIDEFKLLILCLDAETAHYFKTQKLNNIEVIELQCVELKYKELPQIKESRNIVEYYFTLSPILPLYLLETYPEIEYITTLDADICFFNNPKSLFEKFKDYSIMITAHDFSPELKYLEINGKYNVSFQSFRRDEEGIDCLRNWKKDCLEWCYDFLEGNKFADQKYLDEWPEKYRKVQILEGKGLGLAPWNISKYSIDKIDNEVFCNEDKLIFYHFHGLRFLTKNLVKHALRSYMVTSSKSIKNYIYKKYVFDLTKLRVKSLQKDSQIPRIKGAHTFMEKINSLNNNQTYFNIFNLFLLNNNYSFLYKIIKSIIYPPYKLIKNYGRNY